MEGLIFLGWIKVFKLVQKLAKCRGSFCRANTTGFTLIELLLVIVVIGILAAIALPSFHRIKEKAKEAEIKANIHNIQLNVERFAVDTGGEFPSYLIGGDNVYYPGIGGVVGMQSPVGIESPLDTTSDPLIRHGYVDSYPKNPFVRNSKAVHQLQVGSGDPLRNGLFDSTKSGTRFGPDGNLMGQVLCDPRWLAWPHLDIETNLVNPINTWSSVQYYCYDIWEGNRAKPFLPGWFMYKSMGEVVPVPSTGKHTEIVEVGSDKMKKMDNRGRATIPINNSNYILAACGGIRNKGMDILGEEPLIVFAYKGATKLNRPDMFIYDPLIGRYKLPKPSGTSFQLIGIPSWTRGVNRSHVGPLLGSPFTLADDATSQLKAGNPNGFRDSVILVLTPEGSFSN